MTPAMLKALSEGNARDFFAAATPGGIEAQESEGQRDLCQSSRLPKRTGGCSWNDIKSLGIEIVGDADDLFYEVRLPDGWKLRPTKHSMWNELFDSKGQKRASVFFKAAFYDRKAHISLERRFSIAGYVQCDADGQLAEDESATHYGTFITDCGNNLRLIGVRGKESFREDHYEAGKKWLLENYPDWESPVAYWGCD